jgi:carbamoyl-phosphate synthase large subunit
VLVRPSFVLGGRGMFILYSEDELKAVVRQVFDVMPGKPVLIDKFLEDAIELDVDCISDGETSVIGGMLEHIEYAGVHSGDAAMVMPPHTLGAEMLATVRRATHALAKALKVVGLMNVQFAIKGDVLYVLEVNPRASRTVPFVAKAIGAPIAKIAARVMAGEKLADLPKIDLDVAHIAVKEAVFPFARFQGVDPVLSPEMKSTGEVMGIDADFATAFAKAQLGAGTRLPTEGRVFVSVKDSDKPVILPGVRQLVEMGFSIIATGGTARFLEAAGVAVEHVNKVAEGRPHIVDRVVDGDIALVINTTEGWQSLKDSESIRRSALMAKVPSFTTAQAGLAAARAIAALRERPLEVRPLQSYHMRLAS